MFDTILQLLPTLYLLRRKIGGLIQRFLSRMTGPQIETPRRAPMRGVEDVAMTTTTESAPSAHLAQTGTPAAQKSGAKPSSRSDATAVEIPVIVHATRYSPADGDANKALPPLHEETRTAIVFAEGAVVHLLASIAVGQLVVLTNQK